MVPAAGRGDVRVDVDAAVESRQWRALHVFRVVVLVEAIAVNAAQWDEIAHPWAAAAVLAAMAAWTAAAPAVYAAARARGPRAVDAVVAADLLGALATLLLTPWVQGAALVSRHAFTLGSYWIAAAMLAAALVHGWRGGLLAAGLLSAVDVALRPDVRPSTVSNVFLLCLAGGLVGYLVEIVRAGAAQHEQAVQLAAATAERERLARAVHDGVLQALALIQRRGTELGGEAAELARLAGEQEVALRALIRTGPPPDAPAVTDPAGGSTRRRAVPAAQGAPPVADLGRLLEPLATPTVVVSTPGAPVPLPVRVAGEVEAAVREALENVVRHCPPGTRAFVLVEDLPDEVVVTVRDDGPGIPPGRLAAAAAEGRLGVPTSLRGRMDGIGGSAQLLSGSEGTEWELHVPLGAAR
jgi:signal transduction histidine kinase